MLYIVYPYIQNMKKHIIKHWNVKVRSIEFVDAPLCGGIMPNLINGSLRHTGHIYEFTLPPSEQKEVRRDRDNIICARAKDLLKHIRKIFYLATLPEKRHSIYFQPNDMEFRRQELIRHNTLVDGKKAALERLIYLEQVLLGVVGFFDENKSPVSLSTATALRHLEFAEWMSGEGRSAGAKPHSVRDRMKSLYQKLF
jgi:hypothetical protein